MLSPVERLAADFPHENVGRQAGRDGKAEYAAHFKKVVRRTDVTVERQPFDQAETWNQK